MYTEVAVFGYIVYYHRIPAAWAEHHVFHAILCQECDKHISLFVDIIHLLKDYFSHCLHFLCRLFPFLLFDAVGEDASTSIESVGMWQYFHASE